MSKAERKKLKAGKTEITDQQEVTDLKNKFRFDPKQ